MYALVTVKLKKNPEHDPRNKKTGRCPVTGGICTDMTGEHHTYIEVGCDIDHIRRRAKRRFGHVTRIETGLPEIVLLPHECEYVARKEGPGLVCKKCGLEVG